MSKRNYILSYLDQLRDDFFFWVSVSATREPTQVAPPVQEELSDIEYLFSEDHNTDLENLTLSDADLDYIADLHYDDIEYFDDHAHCS